MQAPKAYVIELSERMTKLYNDISQQAKYADWRLDRVSVNITSQHPTIDVLVEADNESQITLPDMRVFERAIEDSKFAITVTLSTHDWSYGELEYYDTTVASNARYEEQMELFEQPPAFELPEGEKLYISEIKYSYLGGDGARWSLSEIDPRTIDELQANHPTTFNILKVAARRTGQQIEKTARVETNHPRGSFWTLKTHA